jgi:hypothetical protein
VLTLEGWSALLYQTQDGAGYTGACVFFVLLVAWGSFFAVSTPSRSRVDVVERRIVDGGYSICGSPAKRRILDMWFTSRTAVTRYVVHPS